MAAVVQMILINAAGQKYSSAVKFTTAINVSNSYLNPLFFAFILIFPIAANSQRSGLSLEMIAETKDNSILSQVVSLDMDTKGDHLKIYLADIFTPKILVLEKKGEDLIVTNHLGREGKGPGDFLEITSLQLMAKNRLMAYDKALGRVTVFDLDSNKVESIFNTSSKNSSNFPMYFYTAGVQKPVFYARAEPYFRDSDKPDMKREIQLQKYDSEGELQFASVMTKPSNDAFIFRNQGNMYVNPQPAWGNKSIFRFKNNHIYYNWTGNNNIEVYNHDGAKIESISLTIPRMSITEDDITRALDFEAFIMELPKEVLKEAYLNQMPNEYWPFINDFFIDDKHRFWIAKPHHLKNDSRVWQIHDKEGILIDELILPAGYTVHQIKNDYLIGELFNFEDFSSTVQIYQLHETE